MRSFTSLLGLAAVLSLSSGAVAQHDHSRHPFVPSLDDPVDCGFHQAVVGQRQHLERIRSGAIPDPRLRMPKSVAPRTDFGTEGAPGIVTNADIFPFEDTAGLLLTNFDFTALQGLMVDAANALLTAHGDNFDFIGYWLNFDAHHTIGAAFYGLVENDVSGIGDVGFLIGEPPLFNIRADIGLAGSNIEGFVMMWNINSSFWASGAAPDADFTRLVLGQEFGHRYGMFLPPLLDGRAMQGDDFICGRSLHWNWQIDGQGSGMEISEWTGSSPAVPTGLGITFNTDIAGSVQSYSDLYLMGYVTPAEMDAGNSELRFMEGSDCSSNFFGTISTFDSSDIIASAGPRVPDSSTEQQDYRTAWVMFHMPGDPPSNAELTKTAGILNQFTLDWSVSTLGRGTMDNTLPAPPAITDLGSSLAGTSGDPVQVGRGTMVGGTSITLTLSNALPGALAFFVMGFTNISAPFKFGTLVPSPDIIVPVPVDSEGILAIPFVWPVGFPTGFQTFFQYWIQDPGGPVGWAASNALLGTSP